MRGDLLLHQSIRRVLVCVDANVIIGAAVARSDAKRFIDLAFMHCLELAISRHSYEEIVQGSNKDCGAAKMLADRLTLLPYFPKGTISELLGTIDELAGTIDDIKRSDDIVRQLGELAKAGADLHDKGALTDALWAGSSHFITSDRDLVANGPRTRIEAVFPICILTPRDAASEGFIVNLL